MRREIVVILSALVLVVSLVSAVPVIADASYEEFTEARSGNVESANDVTAIEVAKPVGTASGDLLIGVVITDGNTSGEFTGPTNWTLIDVGWSGAGTYPSGCTLGAWYLIAGDSEPGSYQWTWTTSETVYAFIIRITGHDPDNPIYVWDSDTGANDMLPICPDVTTTVADTLVLRIFGYDSCYAWNATYPDEHTGITVESSRPGCVPGATGHCSGGAAYATQATAGATGTASFQVTQGEASWAWRTLTIAVRPAPVQYDLTTSSTGGGSVTEPGEGVFPYDEGTVVDLVATPDAGYRFDEWTGDVTTIAGVNAASTNITMDGDYSITAEFVAIYDLTMAADPEEGGTATDLTNESPYEEGTVVSIKAEANEGYEFVNWTAPTGGFDNASAAETTFTMPAQNVTVTANFELVTTTLVLFPESNTNLVDMAHNLTATVYDQFGYEMEGVAVTWNITGVGSFSGTPECPTDVDGEADAVITSSVPGTSTVKCEVTGNPSVYDTATKDWTYTPEATELELLPKTDNNPVDTTHNLTATVYDQFGYEMEGVAVTWNISGVGSFSGTPEGVTDADGEADAVITSSVPGTSTVKCEVTGNPSVYDTATKDWTYTPEATELELLPKTDNNPVDTTHNLTATVYDQFGYEMEGVAVTWNISGVGSFSGTPEGVTDADGQADAVITSSIPGTSTVRCEVTGNPSIFDTATKEWTYTPEATTLELLPKTDENLVDTAHNLTATVYDQFGYEMEGVAVTWGITGVGSFSGTPESPTDADGQADAMVTSSIPGTSTVRCEVTGNPSVFDTATKDWTYIPEATTLELLPGTDENLVDTAHNLTATIYDQFGYEMEGVAVTWNISGVGSFSGTPEGVTDADGQADAVITSSIPGTSTVRCEVTGNPSVYDTATKDWTYTPEATELELLPKTDNNPVDTTHNLTATVYDQFGYEMEGVAVTWGISGVGSFSGIPESPTDADGQAGAVITSSVLGTSTVKCEVTGNPSVFDTATKDWTSVAIYDLTMAADPEVGGTAIDLTNESPYAEGTEVSIKAEAAEGYEFVNWTAPAGVFDNASATETIFTMPAQNVTVTANFEEMLPPVYPTVTTQAATGIGLHSATPNMSYTVGDFSPVEVCFAYKKSTGSAWSSTDWVSKEVDGTYAAPLTGLSSNTEYDFKARLKYNDTVIEGTTLQFTTDRSSLPPSEGCFIATAAYGTPTAEQIDVLREFRDVVLLESTAGSQFVALYYQLSPPVADFISGSSFLRTLVRELLVDPIVWVVEATGDIWQN